MEASNVVRMPPATYVNFLRIAQSSGELFLAFAQTSGEASTSAHLVASLVTSPAHAKAMLRALAQAVALHESRFGVIPEPAAAPAGGASPAAAAPAEPGLRIASGSGG
jgi:hypothetical protein